jgi:hypothetical protein
MVEERVVHKFLVVQIEGKNPLGKHRHRWEDNNKMDFRKLERVVGTGWS